MEEKNQKNSTKTNDWRLQGQEKYLKGVALTKTEYAAYRQGWDHDHCEFCGVKFTINLPDTLHIGYSTNDNYHWVCENCVNDFKSQFEWKLK